MTHAFKKTIQQDSTALINSLIGTHASSPKLTRDEEIAAGFIALFNGPLKMTYGTFLLAGGVVLSCIPFTVGKISTREVTDEHGMRSSVEHVSVGFRKPKTPLHYMRKEYNERNYNRINITKGHRIECEFRLTDKAGTLPEQVSPRHNVVHATTTVTGYNLIKSGFGRIVKGAVDPVHGVGKAAISTGKKILHKN